MIRHHPDTPLLTDFAAGSLPLGQSLCIAVHEESCHQCQQQIAELSHLGAGIMSQLPPSEVDDALFDDILARLDESEAPIGPAWSARRSASLRSRFAPDTRFFDSR